MGLRNPNKQTNKQTNKCWKGGGVDRGCWQDWSGACYRVGDKSGERGGAGGRFVCVSEGGLATRRFRGNFISRTHSQYTSTYMTNSCGIIIRWVIVCVNCVLHWRSLLIFPLVFQSTTLSLCYSGYCDVCCSHCCSVTACVFLVPCFQRVL